MFTGIVLQIPGTSADKTITVPIEYGPKQKWFVSNSQDPSKGITDNPGNNNQMAYARLLPRMVYELTNMQYDQARKLPGTNKNVSLNGVSTATNTTSFVPVPWSFGFQVAIGTKNMDDMSQILEQILPYFQPHFTVNMEFDPNLPTYNCQVKFSNIQTNIEWTDSFDSIRKIEADLDFIFNGYLFLPYQTGSSVINSVDINYHAFNIPGTSETQLVTETSETITSVS